MDGIAMRKGRGDMKMKEEREIERDDRRGEEEEKKE